ncbi:DinB family protein [Glaciimonas sp. PCH181]|uniref:DinB family protein n=1 Tax=Glaciimonas sp. PCH181 TaxID=2133943 RepID=UPI000D36E569|nr:DinB family protein [Glaciimonas sp. PCH181]PUA17972.1 damage-inducible protein DinB [Glaciimonas sp. PCH181]
MQRHFELLARYHLWATEKILSHIASISEDDYRRDCGLFFHSIHGTLNHMLVGELHWHARFTNSNPITIPLNAEVEPDRVALASALHTAVARWNDFVDNIAPERFDTQLMYSRANGEKTTTPFAPTLAHVFNHGTHHRGQLSAALTCLGYPVPELDLIYKIREEITPETKQ